MENAQIFSYVDHTLLSPTATTAEIFEICDQAIQYGTASICIPPSYVKAVKAQYMDKVNICTVIGFPLGYSSTAAKIAETKQALADGATEFDIVINITDAKNGNFDKITEELAAVKAVIGNNILKVIIECCYLTNPEKSALCKCVTDAKADFIKTSTGFGTGGATLEDIRLFKQHIGPDVKIKAAGGMKTKEDFIAFINEGCSRLGTSSAVKVLTGGIANNY